MRWARRVCVKANKKGQNTKSDCSCVLTLIYRRKKSGNFDVITIFYRGKLNVAAVLYIGPVSTFTHFDIVGICASAGFKGRLWFGQAIDVFENGHNYAVSENITYKSPTTQLVVFFFISMVGSSDNRNT